jgi:hypothetical protein
MPLNVMNLQSKDTTFAFRVRLQCHWTQGVRHETHPRSGNSFALLLAGARVQNDPRHHEIVISLLEHHQFPISRLSSALVMRRMFQMQSSQFTTQKED